jgi:hypothetical protein
MIVWRFQHRGKRGQRRYSVSDAGSLTKNKVDPPTLRRQTARKLVGSAEWIDGLHHLHVRPVEK